MSDPAWDDSDAAELLERLEVGKRWLVQAASSRWQHCLFDGGYGRPQPPSGIGYANACTAALDALLGVTDVLRQRSAEKSPFDAAVGARRLTDLEYGDID